MRINLQILFLIFLSGCIVKSNRIQREFYPSGELFREYNFVKGDMNGPFVEYYSDGLIKIKGNYKNGQQHGVFEYYNENSIKLKESNFLNGQECDTLKFYHPNGMLKELSYVENGIKSNHYQEFDSKGVCTKMGYLDGGKFIGYFIENSALFYSTPSEQYHFNTDTLSIFNSKIIYPINWVVKELDSTVILYDVVDDLGDNITISIFNSIEHLNNELKVIEEVSQGYLRQNTLENEYDISYKIRGKQIRQKGLIIDSFIYTLTSEAESFNCKETALHFIAQNSSSK